MFGYIASGIGILCGYMYVFKRNIFYKYTFNLSVVILRNMLWLKQLKQKMLNNKTELIYKDKLIIDDIIVYEYKLQTINNENNYNGNYILKYIIDKEMDREEIEEDREEKIKEEIENKLIKLYDMEWLHEKLNKILHCSFYWEEDSGTIIDLTSDLRHFILYFDCDKTTMCKFMKYMINIYKLNINDNSKCGIYIIKNDETFSEIKISMNNSKDITFYEIFNN
jgi:hypothetical protein